MPVEEDVCACRSGLEAAETEEDEEGEGELPLRTDIIENRRCGSWEATEDLDEEEG